MTKEDRLYLAIDLKSFYASVESIERGQDPFTYKLVVADESRGPGAITLAITPALKALGVKNRCRLFQIPKSIDYDIAKPRMKLYMEYSARVVSTYLEFISFDDIFIYSIDECFINLAPYLKLYNKTAMQLASTIVKRVYDKLGITATAGIGTNLFLAKIAMDITAKHNKYNIGYLDEDRFYHQLSHHKPLTDFWGIGKGVASKLASQGVYDLAGLREMDQKWLYKTFGARAEFLIDHAYGFEPCTIADIKAYESKTHGIGTSQILPEDYNYEDARLIVKEMVRPLALELTERKLYATGIQLKVGYSREETKSTTTSHQFKEGTNLISTLVSEVLALYDTKVKPGFPIRQVGVTLTGLEDESQQEISLFGDTESQAKEKRLQEALVSITQRFGKGSIHPASALEEKSTFKDRLKTVGGHNAE